MKNRVYIYLLLLLATAVAPMRVAAYSASFYANSSVLAEGKWVKVEADTTGIYQVSYEQLRAWGFDDPAKVCVYGYGAIKCTNHEFTADYCDDLPQTAALHTPDGRILFYAEGDVRAELISDTQASVSRNNYDTKAYYFLSDSKPAIILAQSLYAAGRKSLKWNYCIDLIEREVQNPGEGGAFFHGKTLKPGESEDFGYRILDFAKGVGASGVFRYEAAVKTPSATKIPITVSPNVNIITNTPSSSAFSSSPVRLYAHATGVATFNATDSKPLDGSEATFTLTIPAEFGGTYSAIDRAYVIYPRNNRLGTLPQLIMNYFNPADECNPVITDVESGITVWDISDPANVFEYETLYNDTARNASFSLATTGAMRRVVAFQPSHAQREVKFVGELAPQNLHGAECPDMLIVTNVANEAAAYELADIHRRMQGLDVLVARQEDVFNEFSSGSRHPGAIRRLAKMFYDRSGTKLHYLLLYGPATWDPRSITADRSDYLVSYEVDILEKARESATNYCSDTYFGIVKDGYIHNNIAYTPAQIAVGRIPAMNSSTGFGVNKKIREYLENPPTAREYLRALMLSDDGDLKSHTKQSVEAINALIAGSPSLTAHRADISIYPLEDGKSRQGATVVHRVLGSGVGYFAYSGHGNAYSITGENLYNTNFVNSYNYNRWPMAMLSTCDTYPLDRHPNSLAEAMLYKQNGGMIGIIAACRSVYLEHNRGFNTSVARVYGKAAPDATVGDVFLAGRNELVAGSSQAGLGDNTMCYNLCGDPAMPIGAPNYRIRLEKVNGIDVIGTTPELKGMSKVKINASVFDRTGYAVTDFSGAAIIDIYDTPFDRYSQNLADTAYCDEVLLASLPAKIVNGQLEASIAIPEVSAPGGTNRIVITAVDEERNLTAGTMRCLVSIIENNEEYGSDTDTSAPVIEQLYIDSPDFVNGGVVSSDFTLEAVIAPSETGLANQIWGVHANTSLTLDGSTSYPHAVSGLKPDSDGKVRLKLKIDRISDGEHYFTLTAVNNAGNTARATIDFKVVGGSLKGTLELDDEMPVRSSTRITLANVGAGTMCRRLLIRNESGNTVLSRTDCTFPFDWNLRDNSGTTVADGRYTVTALLEDDTQYGSTEPLEIIVIK